VSHYEVLVHVLWEALGGYWTSPREGWRAAVAEDDRLDLRPLAVLHPASRLVPEWAAPLQQPGEERLRDALRRVRATPHDAIAAELGRMYGDAPPPSLRPFLTSPAAALECFARAAEDFWDKHLAHRWPAIRSIAEREVLQVGAALVSPAGQGALNGLHPRISFDGDAVLIQGRAGLVRTEVGDRTLLLIPTVAADDALSVHLDQPGVVQIAYAARGGGELWARQPAGHAEELVALLGEARARVLLAVRRPATTTALAPRLSSSPAAVSFHLQALSRIGLVDRVRQGRRVYYRTSDRGAALIALFLDRESRVPG